MDGERENFVSRRALLAGAPAAAAAVSFVPIAAAVAVRATSLPDPIFAALAAQQITWDAFGDTCSLTDNVLARREGRTVTAADKAAYAAANAADEAAIDAITLTTPTTIAGAFAALRVINERGDDDHLQTMVATILAAPIAGGRNV